MTHRSTTPRVNMLERSGLMRKLFMFALPVFACGVVQQSFNAVDIAVVGKFVSHEALAAVGSNGPVIGLIVNLFMGLSLGANVIIANYIGQRNREGIHKAVSTSAALALASGIGMTIIGITVARIILQWLDTPASVIDDAARYLTIIATGFPAMMIFNFGSAILRSIGDTRRPFYCLVAGGIVNVALDFFFVLSLDMGVEGVAVATSIANYVTAGCIIYILTHEDDDVKVNVHKIKFHITELKKIIIIGLPAGIQGMVFSLSNVFIQSGINSFGPEVMSGSAAAQTYEFYCYYIIASFNQAAIAFIGQNFGAGHYDMCRSIFRYCLFLSFLSCAIVNILIYSFGNAAVSIFTTEASVVPHAMTRISTALLFQFVASGYEISGGALRASGHSLLPMIITIFGTCLLRIVWCSMPSFWHTFGELLVIYPITWSLTSVIMLVAYFVITKKAYKQTTS